jgi:hypothetical protein
MNYQKECCVTKHTFDCNVVVQARLNDIEDNIVVHIKEHDTSKR